MEMSMEFSNYISLINNIRKAMTEKSMIIIRAVALISWGYCIMMMTL